MLKFSFVIMFIFVTIDANKKFENEEFNVSHSLSSKKVFSKCCPLNYAYNKSARFCVKSKAENRFNNQNFLNYFLRNCINKRVTDYYNTDAKILVKTYGNNDYCLDKVYNSKEIVLRRCEEGNIVNECRIGGARCLRKCCPDHEIYVGPNCTATVNVTFNYENWMERVEVLKGMIYFLKI